MALNRQNVVLGDPNLVGNLAPVGLSGGLQVSADDIYKVLVQQLVELRRISALLESIGGVSISASAFEE